MTSSIETGKGAHDPVTEAQQTFRRLRREFAHGLSADLASLGMPVCQLSNGRLVWREPDNVIGVGTVLVYGSPTKKDPTEPLVPRIHLNGDFHSIDPLACRVLGFDLSAWDAIGPRQSDGRLELSVLASELLDFAPWVAAWILCRQELRRGTPPPEVYARARRILDHPPAPFERLLGDVREASYLWSATAATKYTAWEREAKERKAAKRRGMAPTTTGSALPTMPTMPVSAAN